MSSRAANSEKSRVPNPVSSTKKKNKEDFKKKKLEQKDQILSFPDLKEQSCRKCDRKVTKYELSAHVWKHLREVGIPRYKCSECDFGSDKSFSVRRHCERNHVAGFSIENDFEKYRKDIMEMREDCFGPTYAVQANQLDTSRSSKSKLAGKRIPQQKKPESDSIPNEVHNECQNCGKRIPRMNRSAPGSLKRKNEKVRYTCKYCGGTTYIHVNCCESSTPKKNRTKTDSPIATPISNVSLGCDSSPEESDKELENHEISSSSRDVPSSSGSQLYRFDSNSQTRREQVVRSQRRITALSSADSDNNHNQFRMNIPNSNERNEERSYEEPIEVYTVSDDEEEVHDIENFMEGNHEENQIQLDWNAEKVARNVEIVGMRIGYPLCEIQKMTDYLLKNRMTGLALALQDDGLTKFFEKCEVIYGVQKGLLHILNLMKLQEMKIIG